jgi:hypothetical protein
MKIGDSEHSRTLAQILVTFVNELLLVIQSRHQRIIIHHLSSFAPSICCMDCHIFTLSSSVSNHTSQ